MDLALTDILATEARVERDLDRIRTAVTAAEEVTLPAASDAVPGVPTPVGHLNTIANVPVAPGGPPAAGVGRRGDDRRPDQPGQRDHRVDQPRVRHR